MAMASLEDLERRVIALERKAEHDQTVIRAVSEIVAESQKQIRDEIRSSVTASERRMVDTLNERFDAVMIAIDRLRP